MKFLKKVVTWWAAFTVLWWGCASIILFLSPSDDLVSGPFPMSTRAANALLMSTLGLLIYVVLSVVLVIGITIWFYKKKK